MSGPDRLWYRTSNGMRWHLPGWQVAYARYEWALCGQKVDVVTHSQERTIHAANLCRTCIMLSKERGRP